MKWIKLKDCEKITSTPLALFIATQKNPENYFVSWEIDTNIIGCYPLSAMTTVAENDYNSKTIFTIWERKI